MTREKNHYLKAKGCSNKKKNIFILSFNSTLLKPQYLETRVVKNTFCIFSIIYKNKTKQKIT